MRWFLLLGNGLVCVILGGCSLPLDSVTERTPYVPPGAPSTAAKIAGLKKAVAEEKLKDEVEISDVRVSARGWGRYMVCLKGRRDRQAANYYSVFFDNDEYKGVRESAISDTCAQQSYQRMAERNSSSKAD